MPTFSSKQLAEWSGGEWIPGPPSRIDGVSNDTRAIKPGNLYFALKGCNFDGHEFTGAAFDRGACAAVVEKERKLAASPGRPLLQVMDPAKALRDIAAGYRMDVGAKVIAVTGSAGKSTVKEMTAQVLSTTFSTACTFGNWNNDIGLPLSILAMERSTQVGVFELGMNHPGEIENLCEILRPDWGLITNIGPVHIEFFGSLDCIANEKAGLLRKLPSEGIAVLCADGGFYELLKSFAPSKVITISAGGNADYRCIKNNRAGNEAVINEKQTGDNFVFRVVVPGTHNLMNAMFAIAVARMHGVAWEHIREGLENFKPLPMRWERTNIRGISVINDAYNANPLSMRAAVRTFGEEESAGGKWLILSGMMELGNDEVMEHVALGEFVGGKRWTGIVVVGDMAQHIADGAETAGFEKNRVFRCKDNAEAANLLAGQLRAGDTILLKASRAMHLEQILERI